MLIYCSHTRAVENAKAAELKIKLPVTMTYAVMYLHITDTCV